MKAGKYFIGDLSKVMYDENWKTIEANLCSFGYLEDNEEKIFNEHSFFIHTTYSRNDTYFTDEGHGIGVESAKICCCPVEMIDVELAYAMNVGVIRDFKEDFECSYKDGVFTFGKELSIDTMDDWDDDDDDDMEDVNDC